MDGGKGLGTDTPSVVSSRILCNVCNMTGVCVWVPLQISRNCYSTGTSSSIAILLIHDIFGWTFSNTRILADHLAEEVGATVYMPDLWVMTSL